MASVGNEQGTQTQNKILAFIVEYIGRHGYPPCTREICEGTGLRSTNTVNVHLRKMLATGMFETNAEQAGTPRAIRVPGYKFVKVEDN